LACQIDGLDGLSQNRLIGQNCKPSSSLLTRVGPSSPTHFANPDPIVRTKFMLDTNYLKKKIQKEFLCIFETYKILCKFIIQVQNEKKRV